MTTTIDGMPWREARPFGDDGPTYEQWNRDVLAPVGREQGYCLCYHPFADMINFDGMGCDFCGQSMTEESHSEEAKRLRTQATRAAYPQLWEASDDDAT